MVWLISCMVKVVGEDRMTGVLCAGCDCVCEDVIMVVIPVTNKVNMRGEGSAQKLR